MVKLGVVHVKKALSLDLALQNSSTSVKHCFILYPGFSPRDVSLYRILLRFLHWHFKSRQSIPVTLLVCSVR